MAMLEVQHIKKYFATQKAVDDLSFSLKQGSIFGLLGPNGAGKTTLIRMITGIFYPDEGEILFDNKPFNPIEDVSRIGYMPEERGLYKKMKIGDQAVYLAQLKGLSRSQAMARAREWFIRFEMQSWWNKKIEDLGKGMGQKLQFVTTILHDPTLIILDEPFSGLDPVNSILIKDEIFRLAQLGRTIIFSTHRMEQVEEICDHIILMNKGKKILDGSVMGVRQQFKQNLFRIGLENPVTDCSSESFELVHQKGPDLTVKIKEGYRSNDVLQYFIAREIPISSFQEILPTLNDIFIRLVEDTPTARQFQEITV